MKSRKRNQVTDGGLPKPQIFVPSPDVGRRLLHHGHRHGPAGGEGAGGQGEGGQGGMGKGGGGAG